MNSPFNWLRYSARLILNLIKVGLIAGVLFLTVGFISLLYNNYELSAALSHEVGLPTDEFSSKFEESKLAKINGDPLGCWVTDVLDDHILILTISADSEAVLSSGEFSILRLQNIQLPMFNYVGTAEYTLEGRALKLDNPRGHIGLLATGGYILEFDSFDSMSIIFDDREQVFSRIGCD